MQQQSFDFNTPKVCYVMPRKPKISSPLRELRLALGQTQKEFAAELKLSCPWIQALELGQKLMPDELCDDIELKFGIKPGSLKQKQGVPVVWLFEEATVAILPKQISEPILKDLRKLRGQPRERLRYQISRWKKMRPAMEERAPQKEIIEKLLIVLIAASRERKQLTALWRLDRWMENQIVSLDLQESLRSVIRKREHTPGVLGRQPFVISMGALKPQPSRRRKR
jgi:transcriptional regulator with XRE-family HTH domain